MVKTLWPYMRPYKKYTIWGPILVLLDVLCELMIPLLMANIVDIGLVNADVGYIVKTGLAMVLFAILAIVFGCSNMYTSSVASQGFGMNLRKDLFKKVSGFSFSNIDTFSTASLVTRLTGDVNTIQMAVLMGLRMLVRAPIMMVCGIWVAVSISPKLALVLLAAMPLLGVSVYILFKNISPLFMLIQKKLDNLNLCVQENLIGMRVVKSFVTQMSEKAKFKKTNDDYMQTTLKAATFMCLAMPVMSIVLNGCVVAALWFGGNMVGMGDLGAGELISFLTYITQIMMSVMMVSFAFMMFARAQASIKRLLEVLQTQSDIVNTPQALEQQPKIQSGDLEFQNVSFRYSTNAEGKNILEDINFRIQSGQVVGIIGSTGSAKTSLVNLIPRLYEASRGSVLVDGRDVKSYTLEDLRESIGVVLQKNVLFSGTIEENLRWGDRTATMEQIQAAAKQACAHDFIMAFPKGYQTDLGQGGVNVSGGQKQRLCIARAMLKHPKILILDDSTSAVDSATEALIRKSFYDEHKDTTVIIIAQRISSVQQADQILVLQDGKIEGMGTHRELMQSSAVYRQINDSQEAGVSA